MRLLLFISSSILILFIESRKLSSGPDAIKPQDVIQTDITVSESDFKRVFSDLPKQEVPLYQTRGRFITNGEQLKGTFYICPDYLCIFSRIGINEYISFLIVF